MKIADIKLPTRRAFVTGKTGKREVPFGIDCQAALSSYINHPNFDKSSPNNPFWQGVDGSALQDSSLGTISQLLKRASGVDFGWHDLRHTCATEMAAQGVDPFFLKSFLGHSDISTTQKYINLNPEMISEIHSRVSPLSGLISRTGLSIKKRGRPPKNR